MTDLAAALAALEGQKVKFVVIGAVASIARGSKTSTQDLDLCYERRRENLQRLADALSPLAPRLRDLPHDLPFQWDVKVLAKGSNFTLSTRIGDIDLFGEVAGVGGYEEAIRGASEFEVYGSHCLVASLEVLILSKRAAGRPKDLLVLPELEALRDLDKE